MLDFNFEIYLTDDKNPNLFKIFRPIKAIANIGKPAPIANDKIMNMPCKSDCWRMTCTNTAAKIGPAQGVHTKPINAPIKTPLKNPSFPP